MSIIRKTSSVILAIAIASGSAVGHANAAQTGGTGGGYGGNGGQGGYGGQGGHGGGEGLVTTHRQHQGGLPTIGKRLKYYYQPEPQDTSCQWLYNQITTQNMLTTVPRYNECVRRGGQR